MTGQYGITVRADSTLVAETQDGVDLNVGPARPGGVGVMQALNERPTQTVTPAPAESLLRTSSRGPH